MRCQKLNLPCEFQKNILWNDDALERGIQFGRSKLVSLSNLHRSITEKESKEPIGLALTQISKSQKKWSRIMNRCLFLNTTYKDFRPSVKKRREIDENLSQMIKIYDNVGAVDFVFETIDLDDIIFSTFNTRDNISQIDLGFLDDGQLSMPLDLYPSVSLTLNLITNKNLEMENHAFRFMVEKIFPNCICYGGDQISNKNPYLNYLVPLSYNSNLLLKALISYSAKVYSLMHDSEFEAISAKYKDEVLRELPNLIQMKHASNSNDWEEVLGTILILCSSNISSDCDMQWVIHSQGGKKLLNSININDPDPFKKFFIRYLTSHEIMRETITSTSEDSLFLTYEGFKNDHDNEIDLMLGCSPNLLRIISEITKLGEYYESLEQEPAETKTILEDLILTKRDELLNQLDSLIQITKDGDPCIETIAEIKRLSTKVYLFSRLDILEFRFKDKAKVSKNLIQLNELINEIINKIKSIDYCSMSLLWPLFMVGLTSLGLDDELRWLILNKFDQMENRRHLASVKMARNTVEAVWKYRDLKDSELLTWKELVALNNETISLA